MKLKKTFQLKQTPAQNYDRTVEADHEKIELRSSISLEAFTVDNGRARFIIFTLRNPHLH